MVRTELRVTGSSHQCDCVSLVLQDSPFFQQYEIDLREGILGDGTYSVCRKCRHRETGQEYAVKIVSRKTDCTREINLLRACQGHSNIVKLYDVFIDEVSDPSAVQDANVVHYLAHYRFDLIGSNLSPLFTRPIPTSSWSCSEVVNFLKELGDKQDSLKTKLVELCAV